MNKYSKELYFFAIVFAVILLLGGCSTAVAPAPLPIATATVLPTDTPLPTTPPTPEPTATPVPATAVPTVPPATATIAATATSPTMPVTAAQPTVGAATAAVAQPTAAAIAADVCLACHGGSFDELVASNAVFTTEGDETVNPHQYIPHDKKVAASIPECTSCHTPHPLVANPQADLSKVNVDYCFALCHHQNSFTPCIACHENPNGP